MRLKLHPSMKMLYKWSTITSPNYITQSIWSGELAITPQCWHLVWLMETMCSEGTMVWGVLSCSQVIKWPIQLSDFYLCIFLNTFHLLRKVGVSHFHVPYVYYKSTSGWLEVLCPLIILHMWPILVGCPIKAQVQLISKTISKGNANKSLQYGLATNFHPLHAGQWNVYIINLLQISSYHRILEII